MTNGTPCPRCGSGAYVAPVCAVCGLRPVRRPGRPRRRCARAHVFALVRRVYQGGQYWRVEQCVRCKERVVVEE